MKGIPLSARGVVTAMGVALGDLATSMLYAWKAVSLGQGGRLDETQVVGGLSLVVWTIVVVACVKYAWLEMRADNHGEGGVFAVFALTRKYFKWMPVVACVGGAFLLADSVFTPANGILSAVEGLGAVGPVADADWWTPDAALGVAVAVVLALFLAQRAGVGRVGGLFGPVMISYLALSGAVGLYWLARQPAVLRALNPLAGVGFLFSGNNAAGFSILSGVFLAVTGAEALSADQGQLGRGNIRAAWALALACILPGYLGQGAWMLYHPGFAVAADGVAPYFAMMPAPLRPAAVALALLAGVIASQALITAAFSLTAAADGLGWLPRMRAVYPGDTRGQVYIPAVNLALCAACVAVMLHFRSSSSMEAAYGLALIVAMLADTFMLWFWCARVREWPLPFAWLACAPFGLIELAFLAASLGKFADGGYVTVFLACGILLCLLACIRVRAMERVRRRMIRLDRLGAILGRTTADENRDFTADQIVWLTPDTRANVVDRDVAVSMLRHKARMYWAVSVVQTNQPDGVAHDVRIEGRLVRLRLKLGYKVPRTRVPALVRGVMLDLQASGAVPKIPAPWPELADKDERLGLGWVRYALLHKTVAMDEDSGLADRAALRIVGALKRALGKPSAWFGLEAADPIIETVAVRRPAA